MRLDKCVIVNAAYGGWYSEGQKRLHRSLIFHGYSGNLLFFCNQPINELFNAEYPHTIKAAAIWEAVKLGYTHILWVDSSFWAIRNPNPLFDIIDVDGHLFYSTDYSISSTATDKVLEMAELTRDECENIKELAGGLFGLRMDVPASNTFWEMYKEYTKKGMCNVSRQHDNQSTDKRFLYGRRDEVVASICFHKCGMKKYYEYGDLCKRYDKNIKEDDSSFFLMNGL